MPQRVVTGVVTSDKTSQLRRVEIERLVQHRKYKKIIRRKTVCHVHDENNDSAIGDTVEIIESTPVSKLKHWRLVKVVAKSTAVDLAALRAARRAAETEETRTIDQLTDKPETDEAPTEVPAGEGE